MWSRIQERLINYSNRKSHPENTFQLKFNNESTKKSLLQIDEVELEDGSHQRLVKIRNPWAQTEWEGPWGDGTEEWEMVPDYEKERINYENKDDGGFWMSFQGRA